MKLNAVKAAAARKAARRVVMRQVGPHGDCADSRLGTASYPSATPLRAPPALRTLACLSRPVASAAKMDRVTPPRREENGVGLDHAVVTLKK